MAHLWHHLLSSLFPNTTTDAVAIDKARWKTYSELHGLGTGSTELAGHDNLATLGTALHDESQNTVAGTADGQTVEELVAEGLALSDGGQTAVLDLGGIEGDGVLGELEPLLDEGGELANAAALLTENLLGVGGTDDCKERRHPLAQMFSGILYFLIFFVVSNTPNP